MCFSQAPGAQPENSSRAASARPSWPGSWQTAWKRKVSLTALQTRAGAEARAGGVQGNARRRGHARSPGRKRAWFPSARIAGRDSGRRGDDIFYNDRRPLRARDGAGLGGQVPGAGPRGHRGFSVPGFQEFTVTVEKAKESDARPGSWQLSDVLSWPARGRGQHLQMLSRKMNRSIRKP